MTIITVQNPEASAGDFEFQALGKECRVMPRIGQIFLRLGYEVFSVPGVSRAWRREFADRSYLIVTDLGGYGLPEPGGPYSAMYFSSADRLIESIPELTDPHQLYHWVCHVERLSRSPGRPATPVQPSAAHYDLFTN